MSKVNHFQSSARYYDEIHGVEKTEKEVEFFIQKVNKTKFTLEENQKNIKSMEMNILEIGCGTGRFLIPLYEKSDGNEKLKIHGVDISTEMLNEFDRKIDEKKFGSNVFSHEGNMLNLNEIFQQPKYENIKFDAILIISSSLSCLTSIEEMEIVLKQINSLLSVGGMFYCDMPNHSCLPSAKPLIGSEVCKFHGNTGEIHLSFVRYLNEKVEVLENQINNNKGRIPDYPCWVEEWHGIVHHFGPPSKLDYVNEVLFEVVYSNEEFDSVMRKYNLLNDGTIKFGSRMGGEFSYEKSFKQVYMTIKK